MSLSKKHPAEALAASAVDDPPTSTVGRTGIWLSVIVLVGGLLRFYHLGWQSFWTDEALQYYIASAESVHEVLARLSNTFHPPLSYLISHAFLQLGTADVYLRLPSALFGIASLPLVYLLARHLTSRQTAMLAVLICATSPFHLWYSQDGRMYAALLFFSLLSTALLLQAVSRGKLCWWGGYVLIVAAGMYTHVLMALGVLVHVVWVMLWHRRYVWLYGLSGAVALLACLVILLPWGRFLAHRVSTTNIVPEGSISGRVDFAWMALPYTLYAYSAGFSLGPSVADMHDQRSVAFLRQFLPSIVAIAVVFGTLLSAGLVRVARCYGTRAFSLSVLGIGIPLLGLTVLSMLTRFTFNARYTMVAFPYFCLVLAAAITWAYRKHRLLGAVAGALMFGLFAMSLANHYFDQRYAKEDVRSAIAFWRGVTTQDHLISLGAGRLTRHYLGQFALLEEVPRRYRIIGGGSGGEIVGKIHAYFATQRISSAYVLLVRDWYRIRENAVRQAFVVTQELPYPGRVKILKISQK